MGIDNKIVSFFLFFSFPLFSDSGLFERENVLYIKNRKAEKVYYEYGIFENIMLKKIQKTLLVTTSTSFHMFILVKLLILGFL